MKFTILFGLCIVCLFLVGAGYRFYIWQYEEECLEYKVDSWVELHCYDWVGGWHWKMYNETHQNEWDTIPCDDHEFDYRKNFTIYNTTNECIKFHLVRRVTN